MPTDPVPAEVIKDQVFRAQGEGAQDFKTVFNNAFITDDHKAWWMNKPDSHLGGRRPYEVFKTKEFRRLMLVIQLEQVERSLFTGYRPPSALPSPARPAQNQMK